MIVPGLQSGGLADGATQAPIRNPMTNTTAATATRPAHRGRLTSHHAPATMAMTIASRTGIAASSASVRMPRAVVQDATDDRADDQREDQHHADADGSAATMDRRRLMHSREHTQGRVGRGCRHADASSGRLASRRQAAGRRRRSNSRRRRLLGRPSPRTGMICRPGLAHDGRAVVHVAGRGNCSPDTRLDRPHDLDDSLAIGDERLHPITRANLRRWLRRRSVDEDVAALAQLGRERAGLHEAHRAQPAIDPRLVGSEGIGHTS